MKVVTITCDCCKKDSYVNEDDFPLYCSFCGKRSTIYYKAETGNLDLEERIMSDSDCNERVIEDGND